MSRADTGLVFLPRRDENIVITMEHPVMKLTPRHEAFVVMLGAAVLVLVLGYWTGICPGETLFGGGFTELHWNVQDWNGHYWNWWHFSKVYSGQASFFETPFEFFPAGLNTANIHGDLLLRMVGGLLALFISPDWTHTVLVLLLVWGNAVGGYALVKRLCGDPAAGIFTALLFVFSGVITWSINTGNLEYGFFAPICFYLIFLDRVFETGKTRDIAVAAVLGVAAIMTNQVYVFLVAPLSGILFAFRWQGLSKQRRLAVAAVAAVAALLLLPMGIIHVVSSDGSTAAFKHDVPKLEGANLGQEHGVPSLNSYEFANYLPWIHAADREDSQTTWSFWIVLLLAVVLLPWRTLPWVVSGLFFLVLASGPYSISGEGFGEPVVTRLPFYYLYRWVPFFERIHFPHRLFSFTLLCFGVAGGMGLSALRRRIQNRISPRIALLIVGIIVFAAGTELVVRWTIRVMPAAAEVAWYEQLGESGEYTPLVVFPFDLGVLDARHLYYQTRHGQPLFNGTFPRYIPKALPTRELLESNLFINHAYQLQFEILPPLVRLIYIRIPALEDEPRLSAVRSSLKDLHAAGLRQIVLHKELRFGPELVLKVPETAALRMFLGDALGIPLHEDEDVLVWDLPATD
jgi:hypothetical protein